MVNKASLKYILNHQTIKRTPPQGLRMTFRIVQAPVVRSRRKFFEVYRIYSCGYMGCKKSYGTLNHLNTHVRVKRHGKKREPIDFSHQRKSV
ncbi:hypothetical protein DSO57_1003278 [Entomophthora muscae]|uniref:Uncharacterized protein n=2 Tax=Entomophthora muscae TaxID=34485 RepID=A0ACC2SLN7_9FUNG|nr:hypothetical protein DSO57_1003263 [Entomophthora muscae]KAJ9063146.1 hypothetical protein DSO57_1003278 [Entomophthora muscae]